MSKAQPATMLNFTPEDVARYVDGFHIPTELLELHRVRRVTNAEARNDRGLPPHFRGDLSGVVYPIWGADGEIKGHRVRRDHPEIEAGKEKNKYVQSLDQPHLYFELTSRKWLSDISVPVLFVEAYSSALALAAWSGRTGRRFLIVGMGGCWGWHGRIGKRENAHGQRVDETGPSPDLEHIAFKGREVFILLDSNINSNNRVQTAARAFSKELQTRGCLVRIPKIDEEPDVNGPDDFLAKYDDGDLVALLDNAEEDEDRQPKKSQADRLVELAGHVELFHYNRDEAFASVRIGDHVETYRLQSKAFRHWLSHAFWLEHKKAPSAQAIADAQNVLAGRAVHEGQNVAVHVRVAEHDGKLYLDLGDEAWRVIEITADGWKMIKNPPVKFIRRRGMLAIPTPVTGGCLDELHNFINVADEESFALIKGYLVATLRPARPFPVLVTTGEQGSGKTALQKKLKSLVDPSEAPLRALPRDSRDLAIAAGNSWVLAFENVSHIPGWLSDALCSISTGGGFSTRELFTDDDEKIFVYQRPVMLNGITDSVTRPDLLDRSIVLRLPVIDEAQRRQDWELSQAFEDARPRILGALLDAIALAVRMQASTRLPSLPRMADFATWAVAAEPAHAKEPLFLNAYGGHRRGLNQLAVDASVVGPAILQLMEETDKWEGNFRETLEKLTAGASDLLKRSKAWPTSARALSDELKRIAPNLRGLGFRVVFSGHGKKGSRLEIEKGGIPPSPPSPPSPGEGGEGGDGDFPSYSSEEFPL